MRLGTVLRKWRRSEDINIRDAAKDIGLSSATLSRIENGESMDGCTLAKILNWLMSEVNK